MAFYLTQLSDGIPLPKIGKAAFLLANVPGAKLLGTIPDQMVPDLVCIVCNEAGIHAEETFDAACYIDIPRQLEICSYPDTGPFIRKKEWLIVPGAAKMTKLRTK